jgi:hypothetical protein
MVSTVSPCGYWRLDSVQLIKIVNAGTIVAGITLHCITRNTLHFDANVTTSDTITPKSAAAAGSPKAPDASTSQEEQEACTWTFHSIGPAMQTCRQNGLTLVGLVELRRSG